MLGPELLPLLLPFPCPFEVFLLFIFTFLTFGWGAVAVTCECLVRKGDGLCEVSNA